MLLGRSLSRANRWQLFGNQYILHLCLDIYIENHVIKIVAVCNSRRTIRSMYCSSKNNGWQRAHRGNNDTSIMHPKDLYSLSTCRCGTFKLIIMFGSTRTKYTQSFHLNHGEICNYSCQLPQKEEEEEKKNHVKQTSNFVHKPLLIITLVYRANDFEINVRRHRVTCNTAKDNIIGNHTRKKIWWWWWWCCWWFGFNIVNSEK